VLREISVRRVGNVRIYFENACNENMGLEPSVMVYEFHKWVIDGVCVPLVNMATSKDGCEFFRHETLPMWGLQFHPEVERLDNKGHVIFEYVVTQMGFARP
jgi:anthranilate/para-aminobenzoate synthase component II